MLNPLVGELSEIESTLDILMKDWSSFGPYTPDVNQRIKTTTSKLREARAKMSTYLTETRYRARLLQELDPKSSESLELFKECLKALSIVKKYEDVVRKIDDYYGKIKKYPLRSHVPHDLCRFYYQLLEAGSTRDTFYSNADELVFYSGNDRLVLHPFYSMQSGRLILDAKTVFFNPSSMRGKVHGPVKLFVEPTEKSEGRFEELNFSRLLASYIIGLPSMTEKSGVVDKLAPEIEKLITELIPMDKEVLGEDFKVRAREYVRRQSYDYIKRELVTKISNELKRVMEKFSVCGKALVACDERYSELMRNVHYNEEALKEFGRLLENGKVSLAENHITLETNRELELELVRSARIELRNNMIEINKETD